MIKKILVGGMLAFFLINSVGCVALLAGAAGGAGTAVWLSGKLTQEFHSPYEQTVAAAQRALDSLKLQIIKEVKESKVTQLKGDYSDGRDMWVDIHKVGENSSKVEVRVGGVTPDKQAASVILKRIQEYL